MIESSRPFPALIQVAKLLELLGHGRWREAELVGFGGIEGKVGRPWCGHYHILLQAGIHVGAVQAEGLNDPSSKFESGDAL